MSILVIPRLLYKNAHVSLNYVQTAKFLAEQPQTPTNQTFISVKEGRMRQVSGVPITNFGNDSSHVYLKGSPHGTPARANLLPPDSWDNNVSLQ